MADLPKLIYGFDVILIKIPTQWIKKLDKIL